MPKYRLSLRTRSVIVESDVQLPYRAPKKMREELKEAMEADQQITPDEFVTYAYLNGVSVRRENEQLHLVRDNKAKPNVALSFIEAHLENELSQYVDNLPTGPLKANQLARLLETLPSGHIPPKDLERFGDWFLQVDVDDDAYTLLKDLGRAIYKGPARHAFHNEYKKDAATHFFDKALANFSKDGAVFSTSQYQRLLALAAWPGIPNKAVHETLYALLDGAQISDEYKSVFEKEVKELHHLDAERVFTMVQMRSHDIGMGQKFDFEELALGALFGDVEALVVMQESDKSPRLFAPSPGIGSSEQCDREIMIPRIMNGFSQKQKAQHLVRQSTEYFSEFMKASKSLLVFSGHGNKDRIGYSHDNMVLLSDLAASISKMSKVPNMVAFDACSIDLDLLEKELKPTGVQAAHATGVPVPAEGFGYKQVLERFGSKDELSDWIEPSTFPKPTYTVYNRASAMPYSGEFISLRS